MGTCATFFGGSKSWCAKPCNTGEKMTQNQGVLFCSWVHICILSWEFYSNFSGKLGGEDIANSSMSKHGCSVLNQVCLNYTELCGGLSGSVQARLPAGKHMCPRYPAAISCHITPPLAISICSLHEQNLCAHSAIQRPQRHTAPTAPPPGHLQVARSTGLLVGHRGIRVPISTRHSPKV